MTRLCVLVFASLDPSDGAGIQADFESIMAISAHPLFIMEALPVQDNDRAFSISAVAALLGTGQTVADAIEVAQMYHHQALETSYAVAASQRIPNRPVSRLEHTI